MSILHNNVRLSDSEEFACNTFREYTNVDLLKVISIEQLQEFAINMREAKRIYTFINVYQMNSTQAVINEFFTLAKLLLDDWKASQHSMTPKHSELEELTFFLIAGYTFSDSLFLRTQENIVKYKELVLSDSIKMNAMLDDMCELTELRKSQGIHDKLEQFVKTHCSNDIDILSYALTSSLDLIKKLQHVAFWVRIEKRHNSFISIIAIMFQRAQKITIKRYLKRRSI